MKGGHPIVDISCFIHSVFYVQRGIGMPCDVNITLLQIYFPVAIPPIYSTVSQSAS